jgi:hypothetical protein
VPKQAIAVAVPQRAIAVAVPQQAIAVAVPQQAIAVYVPTLDTMMAYGECRHKLTLHGGEWSVSHRISGSRPRYVPDSRLGSLSLSRRGDKEKNTFSAGSRTQSFQSVANRFTDFLRVNT